ncbi:hypothetical protein SLS62_002361 [Diatrype stigma]|uniref:NAD(P)-binding protein n=1 Tax=Diatrype stigma TaxID=117547 RepID=A0AAN9YR09_9PEZI
MSFSFSPTYGVNFVPTLHQQVPEAYQPGSNPLPSPFVVVITGASRGLGRETAQVFAKAGATGLILTARSAEGALEETKKLCQAAARSPDLKVSTVAAASGDEAAAKRIADVVKTEHGGRLDVLINNAGTVSTEASAFDRLEGIRADQIRIPIEANYVGRFLTMQYLLPALLDSPGGARTVINVTSICSQFTGFGALGFNVSALATNRLTEIAAETYADRGLRCYAVHPGTVRTTPPPGMPADALEHAVDAPDLCGAMYLWLARERPDWLSGRYLSAEWDIDELKRKREEIVQGDKLKFKMVV